MIFELVDLIESSVVVSLTKTLWYLTFLYFFFKLLDDLVIHTCFTLFGHEFVLAQMEKRQLCQQNKKNTEATLTSVLKFSIRNTGPLLELVWWVQLHPSILGNGSMLPSIFSADISFIIFVYIFLLMSKSCTHQLKYLTRALYFTL